MSKCSEFLEDCRSSLTDVLVSSLNDEYTIISTKVAECLKALRSSKLWLPCYAQIEENLYKLCTSLPTIVRQGEGTEQPERALNQLSAYVGVLGQEGMRKMCLSSAHLKRLSLALCQCLDFDVDRIAMVSEILDGASTSSSNYIEGCPKPSLPLKFLSKPASIIAVCHIIGKNAPTGIILDHLLDLVEENCGYHERPAFFLLNNLLSTPQISISESETSLVEAHVEACAAKLESLDLDLEIKDDTISDLSLRSSNDTVVAHLSLEGLVVGARILKDRFRGQLLMKTLYPILECSTSSQTFVRDTALWALEALSSACNYSGVEELLLDNSDYLLFSISMNLRHLERNLRSPLVLCAVVEKSGREMFEKVKGLISEVLMSVDAHHVTGCFLLIKVFLEFARAVQRWFPGNQEEVSTTVEAEQKLTGCEEEEESTPKVPEAIRMVVQILLRTKHLVSSPHLPLRLLILDLIRASLEAVSAYENELLPMIHQNWPGVLARFDDEEKNVACKAVEVICCMARLSGNFVHRRIIDEFWPRMMKFLRDQRSRSAHAGPIYQQTGSFRLQFMLLNELGDLLKHIEGQPGDIERSSEMCSLYLAQKQGKLLKDAAERTIKQLDILQKNKGGTTAQGVM